MSGQPAINMAKRLYRDEHGLEYPISGWVDSMGCDCEPEHAVAAWAGHEGRWIALELSGLADWDRP